jgi:hypothetical protein
MPSFGLFSTRSVRSKSKKAAVFPPIFFYSLLSLQSIIWICRSQSKGSILFKGGVCGVLLPDACCGRYEYCNISWGMRKEDDPIACP